MRFEGRSILITGGSGVMGRLIARNVADEGGSVTILDRTAPANQDHDFIHADLSTIEGIDRAVEAVAQTPVDILVNLAGIQQFGPLETEARDHLYATYLVNLVAPARLAQAVLPTMKMQRRGQIANIGSVFGSINFAHFASYSSSKAGLKALSQSLRRELAGTGVSVTYVAPRAVRTPLNGPDVDRFAAATGMGFDQPDSVCRRITDAIRQDRSEVFIGFPESAFVRLNALAPGLIDRALRANDLKARRLFAS